MLLGDGMNLETPQSWSIPYVTRFGDSRVSVLGCDYYRHLGRRIHLQLPEVLPALPILFPKGP